jgi:tRNA(Ile)-lysidine synthase
VRRTVVERVRRLVRDALAAAGIPIGEALVVGVSGGQDSRCLLDAVLAVRLNAPSSIVVAHVQHNLRASDSETDAQFVREQATKAGCRFELAEVDVAAHALSHRLGLEEAGRELRYAALERIADQHRACAVLTGHTLDDSVETLLINLLRGSGPVGLAALHQVDTIVPSLWTACSGSTSEHGAVRLLRPLLGARRSDTQEYCERLALAFRSDLSNEDTYFLRNRVRGQLVPLLATYNPDIVDALRRLGDIAMADEAELAAAARQAWCASASVEGAEVRFARASWISLSVSLQRRLLRLAIQHLGGPGAAPGFQALEAARLGSTRRTAGRTYQLGAALQVRIETDAIAVRRLTVAQRMCKPRCTSQPEPRNTTAAPKKRSPEGS